MGNKYITDEDFSGIDFSGIAVEVADYENCNFSNCIFSNADLRSFSFEDCRFEDCDFSNTAIVNTAFKNVQFVNSKLIGLQFDGCNKFLLEFDFNGCILNYSSFYQLKINRTKFIRCILHEVDFSEAELAESVFDGCDFSGAMFNLTKLQKADFRNSVNFSINPEQNLLAGAKFSLETLPGLLNKYGIVVG